MLQESFAILKRNFNIMLNAKLSFIMIFIGPIFMILIIGGILQNTSLRNLDIAIYTENPADFSEEFLIGFQENLREGGSNVFQEISLSRCKEETIRMNYQACVEVEKNMEYSPIKSENFGSLEIPSYTITTHVDYSQVSAAWKIVSTIHQAGEKKYTEMVLAQIEQIYKEIDKIVLILEQQKASIANIEYTIVYLERVTKETYYHSEVNRNLTLAIYSKIEDIESELTNLDKIYPEGSEKTNKIRLEMMGIKGYLSGIEGNSLMQKDKLKFLILPRLEEISYSLNEIKIKMEEIVGNWNELRQIKISEISKPTEYKSQSLSALESYNVEQLGFIDYLFPSFLMFFIIFISLILPTNLIIRERISNSQIRNMTSKTNGLKFIINNFITCILVVTIQVVILLTISLFFLNADLLLRASSILILIIISTATLSLIGVILGYMFNKFEGAMIASISASIIMLILLPGITPTNVLPLHIAPIMKNFLPIILENKLRTLIIFGATLSFSIKEIISIVTTSLIFLILIFVFYQRSKREI